MHDIERVIQDLQFAQVMQNVNGIKAVVLSQKTVSDVIALLKEQGGVVRCKDCKHFDGLNCKVNDITNIMDTN